MQKRSYKMNDVSPVRDRVLQRGGRWGVRGFRLSLSLRDRGPGLTSQLVAEALRDFGVFASSSDVEQFFKSCSVCSNIDVGSVMQCVVGAVHRDVLQAICTAFNIIKKTARNLTVEAVCKIVRLDRHPDVAKAAVPLREGLFCFFTLWGLPLNAAVSQNVFVEFHTDFLAGIPAITALEMLESLYGVTPLSIQQSSTEELQSLAPNKKESDRIFDSVDVNKNNMLSLAELDLAVIRLWPTLNFKPAIMRAYKLADKNRNGSLSKSEFFAFLHYLVCYNQLLVKFRKIDKNKDGRVSFEELRASKKTLGLDANVTDGEVREIFRAMDANGGGKVLFEEFAIFLAKRQGDDAMSKSTNEFVK